MTRTAVVTGATVEQVMRYLPSNYEAIERLGEVLVIGQDHAGWTMDDYVIPRLASGLIGCREVKA